MEKERHMCKYYRREQPSNWFRCVSPGNGQGDTQRYSADGSSRGLFELCTSAGADGRQTACRKYIEEETAVTAGAPQVQETVKTGGISDRYSFVPEMGMCMYWSRDKTDGKKYHCASPANPHGPEEMFTSVGRGCSSVDRYRGQCRKADGNGKPPRCEFYPGSEAGKEESSGSGMEEIVKKGAKAVVKAALNPGSFVENAVSEIIDDI